MEVGFYKDVYHEYMVIDKILKIRKADLKNSCFTTRKLPDF